LDSRTFFDQPLFGLSLFLELVLLAVGPDDVVPEDVGEVNVEPHESVDHWKQHVVAQQLNPHEDIKKEALEVEHKPGTNK